MIVVLLDSEEEQGADVDHASGRVAGKMLGVSIKKRIEHETDK